MDGGGQPLPAADMAQYRLLKNSIRGPEGSWVEIDENTARQLAANGVVDLAHPAGPVQRGPDITKTDAPAVTKRGPGRPRKSDAGNTAD